MKKINVSEIPAGMIAEADCYSESGELLISKGLPISQKHIEAMTRRNIFEIFLKYPGDVEDLQRILTKRYDKLEELKFDTAGPGEEKPSAEPGPREASRLPVLKNIKPGEEGARQLVQTRKVRELDDLLKSRSAPDRPIGAALRQKAVQISPADRTGEYKKNITSSHGEAVEGVKSLLNRIADVRSVDESNLRAIVKVFVKTFLTDRSILINIANKRMDDDDYLFSHTLNVCLLAINIAAAAKYSEKQILEIGMGALLHDVGMLLVPREIRFKKGKLSNEEWIEIQKHAIVGIHMLKKVTHLPESVLYVTYQTHERQNGTGYPMQRTGRLIHSYAKIVQIADIYESLCSHRSYRPPYIPYQAMEVLLKMSRQNLLSRDFVKTFLSYASLFPIGSFVELSDRCVARVVQANETRFTKPIVSIIQDRDGRLLPEEKIRQVDLAQATNLRIVRPVEPAKLPAIDIMHGF